MDAKYIFVYGTLMDGERAHNKLSENTFIGRYVLPGFAMYNLGEFPGVKENANESVIGEVYEISESQLPEFDYYEGEGYLYTRAVKEVFCDGNKSLMAYVYIYNPNITVEPMRRIWNVKKEDYVWYATYGSNLSQERFSKYIFGGMYERNGRTYPGCTDKSPWIDAKIRTYKGLMYYGNSSSTWDGKGVAFFDSTGNDDVYMRLYKITWEQFLDVQQQECNSPNWYGRVVALDVIENCPVYTITSEYKHDYNEPSNVYRDLVESEIRKIKEEFAVMNNKNERYGTLNRSDYVWYVSYGVNMLEERFLCYIKGGSFRGMDRVYSGCADKSLPLAKMNYILPYEMYCANSSSTWDGSGVAFLDMKTEGKTYGVAYLIKKNQLEDICRQENGGKLPSETLNWYDSIETIGSWDDIDVVTLTSKERKERTSFGPKYYWELVEAVEKNYSYLGYNEAEEYVKRR